MQQSCKIPKFKKQKGFATLPLVIFLVILFLLVINGFYQKEEPIMKKLIVFQAAIKTAEIEELSRAAAEEVVSSYKSLEKIKPELIKADEENGYKVLKHLIVKNIEEKHRAYLMASDNKINFTCFCSNYDYNELKEALSFSSRLSRLVIPARAKHIGSCNESIVVIVNSLDDIKVLLTKDNKRFFCLVQHENVAYMEIASLELKLRNRKVENEELKEAIVYYLENEYGKNMK
jgi:hypothetical protein